MPTLDIDAELPLSALTWDLLDTLDLLEPTGEDNPQPLFLSRDARVRECHTLGGEGQHLKMKLGLDSSGMTWDAIGFRQGERARDLPERIDVVYYLERNEYRGLIGLQLNVQDFRPSPGAA